MTRYFRLYLLVAFLLTQSHAALAEGLSVELDESSRRWVIKLEEELSAKKDLHVELDVRSSQSNEIISYLAWGDSFSAGSYYVNLNQINLDSYSVRARVKGLRNELKGLNTESSWVGFGIKEPPANLSKKPISPMEKNRNFVRGMILFGALFCWLVLLNSWISIRLKELKKSSGSKQGALVNGSGRLSSDLEQEVAYLEQFATSPKRTLSEEEQLLFDSSLDEILEEL